MLFYRGIAVAPERMADTVSNIRQTGFCLGRDAGVICLLTSSLIWKTFGGFPI
jgi:hypothetical protein